MTTTTDDPFEGRYLVEIPPLDEMPEPVQHRILRSRELYEKLCLGTITPEEEKEAIELTPWLAQSVKERNERESKFRAALAVSMKDLDELLARVRTFTDKI